MLTMLAALAPDAAVVAVQSGNTVDFTWLFVKMILALTIVIVLAMLFLRYGLPRLGLAQRFQQGRFFTMLRRQGIEPRKSLGLVQVGSRYFVIGIADHAITPIAELTETEAKAL